MTDITPPPRCFAMVAGEVSGDALGAGLITQLRERFPNAQFVGIGGPQMVAAGLNAWFPAEQLSVMGLVEVLRHLPKLLRIRRNLTQRLLALRPDCFIGIDAPDFNLALERKLKSAGVKTAHYVSPSIWAWRKNRAKKIGRSADVVLCLFPIEPPIYASFGVNARFVGHPMADAFPIEPDRGAARRALGLSEDVPLLALLPGSRLGEIRRLGMDFLNAAQICHERLPTLRVIAPMANAAGKSVFAQQLASTSYAHTLNINLLDGQAGTALRAADAVLVASGTATLEAMLAKTPMVVAYRLAALSAKLITALRLMRTPYYSLPNVLAGRKMVPELMQSACTPDALAKQLLPYLRTRQIPPELAAEFTRQHVALRQSAHQKAANAIVDLIGHIES